MFHSQDLFRSKLPLFWPLRLIAALTLAAPAIIFAYATWQNYRDADARANDRIERQLDVLQEHALKSLQTVERSISEINEVLSGLTDEEIRARESDLFLRFKRTQQALPQIGNIMAFNADGAPLASSFFLPVPDQNVSDRNYFQVQKAGDAGTYVSELLHSRINALSFFVMSGRRSTGQAGFTGIISVTVIPEHFTEFYRKLADGRDYFALVKDDGALLARFPETKLSQAMPRSELAEAMAKQPQGSVVTATSAIDSIKRRIGYRKVPDFPVYVEAGIETAAITGAFWRMVATQMAIGLPVVLAMFALAVFGLRRAERFQEETARREAAESALKQAQRLEAIGQLTGGVAHDFNNLLMVVGGNAERLKRYTASEERARRALEAIEIAVKRGADLTRQLLSFSRRQTHEAKIIDLNEHLPIVQAMLQSSLRGDIAVHLRIAEGLWPTKIDVSEFELALLNMAVNARDAMSTGGRLTIAARNVTLARPGPVDLAGEFVAVSVQDTGAGIPPDVLKRVFEPFFTTKEVGKGTGLGLSQVYGFAQQAGGTAHIESTMGAGTTVTLYLPRALGTAAAGDKAAQDDKQRTMASEHTRVLLVEDNTDVAEVARGYLEEFGHKVHHVLDVPTARTVLRSHAARVDVVLSDIVMPGGANGVDLARWIRQEYGPGLPVLLATGYSDQGQAAADEGFTILRKPYTAVELHTALTEVIRLARKRDVA